MYIRDGYPLAHHPVADLTGNFDVTGGGSYTVHSLVYPDPTVVRPLNEARHHLYGAVHPHNREYRFALLARGANGHHPRPSGRYVVADAPR